MGEFINEYWKWIVAIVAGLLVVLFVSTYGAGLIDSTQNNLDKFQQQVDTVIPNPSESPDGH